MGDDRKVIDLEIDDEGVYVVKKKSGNNRVNDEYKKHKKSQNQIEDFLIGIDIGLDLLESAVPRIKRLLQLREK